MHVSKALCGHIGGHLGPSGGHLGPSSVACCARARSAKPGQVLARPVHPQLPLIMQAPPLGARRVLIPQHGSVVLPVTQQDREFRLETVEVFALLMKAVRDRDDMPNAFWKPARKALARLLLGMPPAGSSSLKDELYYAAKKWARVEKGVSEDAAKQIVEDALAWVGAAQTKPQWQSLRPILQGIVELDPQPVPQISRDGSAVEDWAGARLTESAASFGWSVHQTAVRCADTVKGVKGEADGLLLDGNGMCHGVIEVKLGGSRPYRALFNDIRKLLKLLKDLDGQTIDFSVPGENELSPSEVIGVPFAASVAPLYLVVSDSAASMDGTEVLAQAQGDLVRIGVSMYLASPAEWVRGGTRILSADPLHTELQVRSSMISAVRKNVSADFFDVLASTQVYQVTKPAEASW